MDLWKFSPPFSGSVTPLCSAIPTEIHGRDSDRNNVFAPQVILSHQAVNHCRDVC